GLDQPEGGEHVGLVHPLELLGGERLDAALGPHLERGVRHHGVETPESLDGVAHQRLVGLLGALVRREQHAAAALLGDGLLHLGGVLALVGQERDRDVGTLLRERDRGRPADAGVAAGDEGALALEPPASGPAGLAMVGHRVHLAGAAGPLLGLAGHVRGSLTVRHVSPSVVGTSVVSPGASSTSGVPCGPWAAEVLRAARSCSTAAVAVTQARAPSSTSAARLGSASTRLSVASSVVSRPTTQPSQACRAAASRPRPRNASPVAKRPEAARPSAAVSQPIATPRVARWATRWSSRASRHSAGPGSRSRCSPVRSLRPRWRSTAPMPSRSVSPAPAPGTP